ncbi:interleukin-12 receptor subunit beta-1 isoform X3 [Dipodomys merriami]|uniref:interleukin-12 receptor subunit beta-1 isoform X3 n=1 Tax=Dipodomys merriami TaxID=94247 RepID=UPI0038560CE0
MGLPAAGLHLLSLLVLSQQGASCPDRGCCFQELPPPSAAPNPGLSADSDWGPTDLSCYRTPGHGYQCSWRYEGPTAQLRHFLRCCMHDACGSRCCCYFEAAAGATRVQFSEQDGVSVLSSVSLWVESRVGNRTARSPELRLRLYRWVRYDPPDREAIAVSRTGQTLRLEWEAQVEADAVQAQLRRRTPRGDWQQADCGPQDEAGPESCPCPLLPDAAQEIQVRRRRLERSGAAGGPWSSWSGPVCVPRGDLRAPDVSFVAEPLGLDGTRLVSVREQPPEPEQPEGCRDVASGARVSHWPLRRGTPPEVGAPGPGPRRALGADRGRGRRGRRPAVAGAGPGHHLLPGVAAARAGRAGGGPRALRADGPAGRRPGGRGEPPLGPAGAPVLPRRRLRVRAPGQRQRLGLGGVPLPLLGQPPGGGGPAASAGERPGRRGASRVLDELHARGLPRSPAPLRGALRGRRGERNRAASEAPRDPRHPPRPAGGRAVHRAGARGLGLDAGRLEPAPALPPRSQANRRSPRARRRGAEDHRPHTGPALPPRARDPPRVHRPGVSGQLRGHPPPGRPRLPGPEQGAVAPVPAAAHPLRQHRRGVPRQPREAGLALGRPRRPPGGGAPGGDAGGDGLG